MAPEQTTTRIKTLIIGTGFGGLCMGVKLKESGENDFLMVEAAEALGGTWRENTYPGAECDIASALYSFSFAPNPTWDFKWAKQAQILEYQNKVADDFTLRGHMRFGQRVKACRYDAARGRWCVETQAGHHYDCQFLITAVGQLHHPNTVAFQGADSFDGPSFHSAQWDHGVDLSSKRIGVIGNAASAVQFIPEIAKTASHVTVYQRSANWMIDKVDRPYFKWEKALLSRIPKASLLYRFSLWVQSEYVIWPAIKGSRVRRAVLKWKNRFDMKRHIKDTDMREALTSKYPIGAKRILFSDKYYKTLAQDHVKLVTSNVGEIIPEGIVDKAGETHAHDVIIYSTGFHTNPFLKSIFVTGEAGMSMREHWSGGAYAYYGVMTAGFPNLFMMYGPNTNSGHMSIIFKLEKQADYIVKLMQKSGEGGRIAVKPDAEARYNVEMQTRLQGMIWNQVENSWYKDGSRLTNNWPGSASEYRKRLKNPAWADYRVETAQATVDVAAQ